MKFSSVFFTLFAAIASVEATKVISYSDTPLVPHGESLRSSADNTVTIGGTTFEFADINDEEFPETLSGDFPDLALDEDIVIYGQYQWGLDRIDQVALPLDRQEFDPEFTGKGVDVYVVDTGVDTKHPEFDNRASYGIHLAGSKGDVHGHGTHVGSTVAGNQVGVARGANIIDVKVLGDGGSGSTSGVIRGIAWAVEQSKKSGKCSVISMSLGGGKNSALNKAVEEAYREGVLVVVAAGNSNQDANNYSPASEPRAITVGSTTDKDVRSFFSNHGKSVDIFAPGSSILGANANTKGYKYLSGTSMACPHVSGVAALLMEEHGCSDLNKITNILLETSLKGKLSGIPSSTTNRLLQVSSVPVVPTPQPTPAPTTECESLCEDSDTRKACRNVPKKLRGCKCNWNKRTKKCTQK